MSIYSINFRIKIATDTGEKYFLNSSNGRFQDLFLNILLNDSEYQTPF